MKTLSSMEIVKKMIFKEQADFDFLLDRFAQSIDDPKDEIGMSSNSIVAIAYGIQSLAEQELPADKSDLERCVKTWQKLPAHRRVGDALAAMYRAENAVK